MVASATTFSVAANSKSVDQVSGVYQFVGKGMLTLASRASVTGLNATLAVNGIPIVNDQPHPFFGATGGLSTKDHIMAQAMTSGGRVELTFRNTSGGAITVDFYLTWDPMK